MTTQRLSSERLIDTRLLADLTKRRLPHVLVSFLACFFTVTVPFMLHFTDRHYYDLTRSEILDRIVNGINSCMTINLFMSFALGIYFAVVAMSYMMKRKSAYFWHALPQKRQTLFATSNLSALLCAAAGATINLSVALVVLGTIEGITLPAFGAFFICALKNSLYFLVIYAAAVFAGSFSGSGVVQVLMSFVTLFYAPAAYLGIVLLRSLSTVYFDSSYYCSFSIIRWLSPAFYLVSDEKMYGALDICYILTTVIASAVLIALALVIYLFRANENAEKTIVFDRAGGVIKYLIVFASTMFAGLFFEAISGSAWMLFGFVCGCILSFMLVNTILAKSPKQMFRGIKRLPIFILAFAMFFIIVGADVLDLDRKVPDSSTVSYVEIDVADARYADKRFDDPEIINALAAVIENQLEVDSRYYDYIDAIMRPVRIKVVFHTKLGIPIARTYRLSKATEGIDIFLRLYADDGRMNEFINANAEEFNRLGQCQAYAYIQLYENTCDFDNFDISGFWQCYSREIGTLDYARLSKPSVGYIYFYSLSSFDESVREYNRPDMLWELPIYADMTDTVAYLEKYAEEHESEKNYNSNIGMDIVGGSIYYIGGSEKYPADYGFSEYAEEYPRSVEIDYYDRYEYAGDDVYNKIKHFPSADISAAAVERLKGSFFYGYCQLSRVFLEVDTDFLLCVKVNDELDSHSGYSICTYPIAKGAVPADISNALKAK